MHIKMRFRHALVAVAALVVGGLTAFGVVGPAAGPERIHAYRTDAIIASEGRVQVREVIDWDFSLQSKHGIFRTIPHTGGIPQDISVSSPTAPDNDQFTVIDRGSSSEIKIGDPSSTISGRHRYVITYTLLSVVNQDHFALNAIGTEFPVPIEQADVSVLGATLGQPACFTGTYGSTETCEITRPDGGAYKVTADNLDPKEGITVEGDVTATSPASFPEPPPFEDRDSSLRGKWAAIVVAIGGAVGLGTYVVSRRIGRNEVAAGGATEAVFGPAGNEAFGPLHPTPDEPPPPVGGTRFVADENMHELAGIEFVPPCGVEPWQAAVVLHEKIDNDTVSAWFSSLVARDIMTITNNVGTITLAPGSAAGTADASAADVLNRALPGGVPMTLGTYDAGFANVWNHASTTIAVWTSTSGVFRRRPPGQKGQSILVALGSCVFVPLVFVGGGIVSAISGSRFLFTAPAAVLAAIIIPGVVAVIVYQRLWRSLSARGSAIALRSESFRRFLHDSEAQHVEWAWQNGLLREYSAWAVALGEVAAWNAALAASSVPPAEMAYSNNILIPAIYASSFTSTTTAPSSSGSSGFSGGGGGFSGGGGGGGGGGSW